MTFQRVSIVEAAPLQEELMLFHPQTNKFCVLNHTTSFIWACLANPSTVGQLAEALCGNFEGATLAATLRDVQEILKEMLSLEIVVSVPSSQEKEL